MHVKCEYYKRNCEFLYRTGEEKRIERYKVRVKNSCDQPTISEFIKKIIDFLGLKDQAKTFGIGSFDIKSYRLEKVDEKVENYVG